MTLFPIPFSKHITILTLIISIGHFSLVFFDLNISSLLDFYLIGLLLFNFKLDKTDYRLYLFSILIILLILLRFFYSSASWDSTYFFISLKLLIFFVLFISIKPVMAFNKLTLIKNIKYLFILSCVLIFTDKIYAIFTQGLLNGLNFRPRLIGEINFDIVLIIEMWLLLRLYDTTYKKYLGYILFFIVIISLSRSGIIGYVLTLFFYNQLKNKSFNFISFLRNISFVFIGLSLILLIYYIRDPKLDFANIDRIQLLNALVNSYGDNAFLKLLIGNGLLVPLPSSICLPFSMYAKATTGDAGNCNPVILFSFFLRCTYEYGVIIMFLIPYFYYKLLSKTVNKLTAMSILIPVISISLAVGGFYNSIAILSILIAKYTAISFEDKLQRNINF